MQGPGSLIEEACRCFVREGGCTGVRVKKRYTGSRTRVKESVT